MNESKDFFHNPPAAGQAPLHITDEAEACAAVLFACLRANELDGMTENRIVDTIVSSRNIFQGTDGAALIERCGQYYAQAGSPAALIDAAIGAIREQTRLPLFFNCLDVILSDGIVTPAEHKIFQYLRGKFKVEDELAWKGMEVLVAKNQL